MLACLLLACSPNLRGTASPFQLLVFPGEAELGGTAAAVISSNYLEGEDDDEKYTLRRSQIGIQIEDAAATQWNATVRAVFPIGADPTSHLAHAKPGAWATVVLFDLPTAAAFDLGSGPPFLADVTVVYNGTPQTTDGGIGSIRITGRGGAGIGGQPTQILWPQLPDLELQSLIVRMRPNLDTDGSGSDGGFTPDPAGVTIAGIEGDLIYIWACLTDFEPATGTEASDAGISLGPQLPFQNSSFLSYRHLVLTYPQGLTLVEPSGGANDALGEGPLIDITFDRPNQTAITCGGIPILFRNVYVVAPDGTTIADERGQPYAGVTSQLFSLHTIPGS